MQIELPDQTAREVETLLTKQGRDVDISAFVNETLQRALYFEVVREVKQQNAGVDPATLEAEIDEAVDAVRSTERKASADADSA